MVFNAAFAFMDPIKKAIDTVALACTKAVDLLNDITIVDVHYKLRSQSRASMPPAQQDVLLPSQQHEALLPQQQSPPQQQSESAY